MSKNQKKSINKTTLFTLIVIGVVAVAAGLYAWISCGQPWAIESYEEMKDVSYYDYKNQKETEYYVFVYSEVQPTSIELEASVSEYANYARLHNVTKIYGLNYNDASNSKIASDLSITDVTKVARLVLIKNGSVSTKYTDWDDINNNLQESMNK